MKRVALAVALLIGLATPSQADYCDGLAASRLPPGLIRDTAVRNRDIVAAKMTPAQIAEAQRLAREWKPKSERSGPQQ